MATAITTTLATAARRTTRAAVGLALVAVAIAAVALAGTGFTTSYAKTTLSCGAAAVEAWPEQRPKGPTDEELAYLLETGNWAATAAYRAEAIAYVEARACGRAARSRLTLLLPAAAIAWFAGGVVLRQAFRRTRHRP